ncbi:MAG TPA: VWA domain-containing protein [Vicinamibacterales bacterium]
MSQPSRRRGRIAAVLVILGTAVVLAQDPGQTPPVSDTQPTFRTEANFVLTDVFVTADGRPVTDLTVEDFELREDGVLQTIRSFEHVQLGGPTTTALPRRSPSSVAESRAVAADPRRRVFVLFLDTFHITRGASMVIREHLKTFVSRVLGPDDLIAFMTPQMAGGDISFSTDANSILQYLESNPVFGVADELPLGESDPVEKELAACFLGREGQQQWATIRSRMREERTLKALESLVAHLSGLRESRKAIITVTEGWNLYTVNETHLTDRSNPGRAPGIQGIGVGPDGRLGTPERYQTGGPSDYNCDTLRLQVANADTRVLFEDIIREANRNNASFYTLDARGLRTETRPIPTTALESAVEMRNRERMPLSTRLDSIKRLGLATNGLAIADSNDFSGGFQRIADDFNSFYLLGYNSTNTKLDGGYRRIQVKVKRPGVQVRHREGYRAARQEDVLTAAPGGPRETTAAASMGDEERVTQALGRLPAGRSGVPFVTYASGGVRKGSSGSAERFIRVVAELDPSIARDPDWVEGGQAQAYVRGLTGDTLVSTEARLEPGRRTVELELPVSGDMPDEIKVQVRLTGNGPLARFTDTTTVRFDTAAAGWGAPIVLRRGPTTGTAWVPTADLRFRRQERVRIRVDRDGPSSEVAGTLLDRRGNPIDVPVRVNRTDASPLVAELTLAPLATGDYVIALGQGSDQLLVAFRVIP